MEKDFFSESIKISKALLEVRKIFDRWGYSEIFLPFMEEFCSPLRGGMKFSDGKSFYLVKPDVTSQILKNLKAQGEYRFFYLNEVFAEEKPFSGGFAEKIGLQAGAEFIGLYSLQQKIEIISIILTVFSALSFSDFYIDFGSLKTLRKIIKSNPDKEKRILQAFSKRDFTSIEKMSLSMEEKENLFQLFNFRGKNCNIPQLDEILNSFNDERLFIDTGTVRYQEYYEDIVFEIYSPLYGKPVGGGGDYKIKGMSGFGFGLDIKKIISLSNFDFKEERMQLADSLETSYEKAREEVLKGNKVEVKV